MDNQFSKMKLLMAADVLSAFPDHNIYFDVTLICPTTKWMLHHTRWLTINYNSKKLNSAQQNNTTTEIEMLPIMATLEEFQSMLLSADIHVFIDHKSLTFDELKMQ